MNTTCSTTGVEYDSHLYEYYYYKGTTQPQQAENRTNNPQQADNQTHHTQAKESLSLSVKKILNNHRSSQTPHGDTCLQ